MNKQADQGFRRHHTTTPESNGKAVRERVRLTPQERIPQILDAALIEFTSKGFAGTRMDDIAKRCELSKGGLYAHFDSKDAIFKALLERALHRTDWEAMPQLAAGATPRELAEWIVDRLHAALLTPETLAVLKLLIPERERVPGQIHDWQQNLLQLRSDYVVQMLQENLGPLVRQHGVLARHPWLALSPVMHVLLWRTLFGDNTAPDIDYRQAHVDLLCELLDDSEE